MHLPRTRRKGLFRFSGQTLLGSLIFLFIAYPFVDEVKWGQPGASLLFTFILLASLLAVGGRRGVLIAGLVIFAPALAIRWLHHMPFLGKQDPIPLLSMSLAIGFTAIQLLRFILRAKRVDSEVLCSAISVYLLMALFWAHLYLLVDNLDPGSFSSGQWEPSGAPLSIFDSIYFSLSTLTTASYGDIAPLSRYARALTSLEAVGGVLYMAVLISRLVSLYSKTPAAAESTASSQG